MFNESDLCKSEFYISVPNKQNSGIELDSFGNFTYDYKYGRKAGQTAQYVKRVPISRENISDGVIERLSVKVPLIFEMMKKFNWDNSKTDFLKEEEKL